MGRGRAKAKQTKVARDLKYRTHETDFDSLAKELHGGENTPSEPVAADELPEEWSDYADRPRD
ncbi:DUF3073 domain-containing protein [Nocardioides plantarum]|uniref:DUF3073 domain-containing protein n=1 Tax=Nocardioides plantarum TaxID=29299 RepID=A0ABV5K5L0_9ACTN|nr:DUF3073 domain-containing protein [Nocardioides plantarum]